MTQFGIATQRAGKSLGPAEISREAGGAFSLFDGYVTGRHIELAPAERIVPAWRVASWNTGVYSIARFELMAQGAGTRIVFDHIGFPAEQLQHFGGGWKGNYWSLSRNVWLRESAETSIREWLRSKQGRFA